MKKLICILLAICCLGSLALAEEANPFAPYTLTVPEGAALEENEGTHTVVSGVTRVVAMVIPRVPDENPSEAVIRMMGQFDPQAVIGKDLALAEGFTGLTAVAEDAFGKGVHRMNVMILCAHGDLLILSGYDLSGDTQAVQTLLDALLTTLTAGDAKLLPEKK